MFSVHFDDVAYFDLLEAKSYYNEKAAGLGNTFERVIFDAMDLLETIPHFQIRYDSVRCLPIKQFPYMIHFTVDELEKEITIRAIVHTSKRPRF